MTISFAKRFLACFPLILSCGLLAVGCSEDEQEAETIAIAPDCQAILDVCTHDVTGDVSEACHEVGHANDAAECAAQKHDCVDGCTNAHGEGGAAGAEH